MTLGINLIGLLKKLHEKGYIHCDLKPDNVMIGNGLEDIENLKKIYLIDFGISMRYLDEEGNHIPMKTNVPFRGNLIF